MKVVKQAIDDLAMVHFFFCSVERVSGRMSAKLSGSERKEELKAARKRMMLWLSYVDK